MQMTLGIDVACRAAHQASLADEAGRFAWSGRKFRTAVADLEWLWESIPANAAVTVVMEPTRNAWVPLAAWFWVLVPWRRGWAGWSPQRHQRGMYRALGAWAISDLVVLLVFAR